MAIAFVLLAVMPEGQKTVPLLIAAFGWFLVTLDDRVKRFASRFPRWLGAVLMIAGFAVAYFGARAIGSGRYLEVMGTALSLLSVGYLFLRRGH
jgi:Na+/pantothenate symporter